MIYDHRARDEAKPWGWQTLSVRIRLEESGKRNHENLSSYTKVKKQVHFPVDSALEPDGSSVLHLDAVAAI